MKLHTLVCPLYNNNLGFIFCHKFLCIGFDFFYSKSIYFSSVSLHNTGEHKATT